MPAATATELLRAYDTQLRARVPDRLPAGETLERDGPLLRFSGGANRGWVLYEHLDGIEGDALDALIARQVEAFRERGQRFEWKHHGHDAPADLVDRLLAHGFEPEATETIVIGRVADVAGEPVLPRGVTLRDVTSRADFERIAGLENTVWGDEPSDLSLADMLEGELAVDPDGLVVTVAEAADTVVCAAWIRFPSGATMASLWGGATLVEWRRKGIYRATVAHRANLATSRGYRYLQTDASDDSRPILERLGFIPVTTTTPYLWTPPAG